MNTPNRERNVQKRQSSLCPPQPAKRHSTPKPPEHFPLRHHHCNAPQRRVPTAMRVQPAPAPAPAPSETQPADMSQDPMGVQYQNLYSTIDETVLFDLVDSDSDPDDHLIPTQIDSQLSQQSIHSLPPQSFSTQPSPIHTVHTTTPMTPTPSSLPDSFPNSPPARVPPTPNPLPQYTMRLTPQERNFALDYDACMTAIGDFNRMSSLIFRREVLSGQIDGTDINVDRSDVIPILFELRDMLNRLHTRLNTTSA